MLKRVVDTKVISNILLTEEYFVLKLSSDFDVSGIRSGQFVQVRIDDSPSTFLRRPISVYDTDIENNTIRLLIKIAGNGTRSLSRLSPGDSLNILLALGNSFTMPPAGSKSLLVGGGVGVAPLYLLGKQLKDAGMSFSFLLGYRTFRQVIEPSDFQSLGDLIITTEDGTGGYRGFVTDHPVIKEGGYTHIFCCGPEPMMKAVASAVAACGAECEVSLENMMACGIGICLCCVEATTGGNVNTCTQGPVFNIKDLKWQI